MSEQVKFRIVDWMTQDMTDLRFDTWADAWTWVEDHVDPDSEDEDKYEDVMVILDTDGHWEAYTWVTDRPVTWADDCSPAYYAD